MKNLSSVLSFGVVIVILALTLSTNAYPKPQGWVWGEGGENKIPTRPTRPTRPPRPTRPTRTPSTTVNPDPASSTTMSSIDLINCQRNCPTTPQYNPVCGSNRVTYDNLAKFDCAVRCGLNDLTVLFNGRCQ